MIRALCKDGINALVRADGGCTKCEADTGEACLLNRGADFQVGRIAPRNSADLQPKQPHRTSLKSGRHNE